MSVVACARAPGGASPLELARPEEAKGVAPPLEPKANAPRIAALSLDTRIYERPDPKSRVLGHFRLGQSLARSDAPVPSAGTPCWYQVAPRGYVCATDASLAGNEQGGATLDLNHKIIKALGAKPDLSKPMPYVYGFVRRDATLWNMVPDHAAMDHGEYGFQGHLKAYKKHHKEWNHMEAGGANQVPLDAAGNALGLPKDPPPPPPVLDEDHLFPDYGDGSIPGWLAWDIDRPARRIPNVSSFIAPEDSVSRGKISRHAGVAVLGSFRAGKISDRRKLTVLLDGRLIGEDKIRPHLASAFHGIPLDVPGAPAFPFAMVRRPKAYAYGAAGGEKGERLTYRDILPLTGKVDLRDQKYYFQTRDGRWLHEDEVAVFAPPEPPKAFDWKKTKWIDVSITYQTLVLYEGEKPVYATLVSTGADGAGDPHTTKSTIRGEFKIDWKHVTATMDADDPESHFELRDVPWVQYFEGGYALHAAYWHDDFGRPRSHGCVNLSPIDARRVFFWTDPPLPEAWHAVHAGGSMGPGTWVRVRR